LEVDKSEVEDIDKELRKSRVKSEQIILPIKKDSNEKNSFEALGRQVCYSTDFRAEADVPSINIFAAQRRFDSSARQQA